ncbi:15,16-dihydrobiliverdin:ferredoxin oxidoreductase [Geminocystis sp. GBBB08]|uniref:15,16-dihydrobiliverdin:ferredoxin oxidoreductase n=1 Tax=Geminocystis sp. GBBB08 TaxID=2604140 RepID=UPI0027E2C6F3|nr:15,16-dihydrobiliverdin:ferredoxin oxidoreductase [Geminocystis sp. GBBB08]MBL1208887.1 15,16-dihydrobiliverdin:ferredoxin oxidoreductase [Geminocystis sp. GBBB08]
MYKAFQEFLEKELFEHFELRPRAIPSGLEMKISERGKNPARIKSWCYECPQLRIIRYTYIDAWESAQRFNSAIYSSYHYDFPLLGIDFLSFGKVKNLVVLDFQPLFQDERYLQKYIDPMSGVRNKYSDLAQNLEMKFYDANRYFSRNLLFAKTDTESIFNRLFPAYQEYLQLYWQMVEEAEPLSNSWEIERVVKAQQDYDQYSAERDPAHGLFSSYFGSEWANRFLHEFLFEDSLSLTVAK